VVSEAAGKVTMMGVVVVSARVAVVQVVLVVVVVMSGVIIMMMVGALVQAIGDSASVGGAGCHDNG
jgi:hypothetical protein